MDKRIVLDIETAARIEREVRDNGRNIADNSLRLMTLSDDIERLKKSNEEYNAYAKEYYAKMDILLEELKQIRRGLDSSFSRDREYRKVGVV